MDDQRLRVAHVGYVREELHRLDAPLPRLPTALDAECEDRAGALGQVLLGQLVVAVRPQPRVVDVLDRRVLLEELGHLLGVGDVAVHAHVQRLQPLQEQEGGEGLHGRPVVAQHLRARLHQPAEVAEVLEEAEVVVALGGFGHARELAVVPGEAAAVHDHASDGRAVPADELGRRMDDDVGAPVQGPAEVGRGEGVVDDQRHARVMRDLGDAFDVEHVDLGIAHDLGVEALGLVGDRAAPGVEV